MKDRTLLVLQALIEDFIATANPIASQRLLESHNFNISSATIRNEFSVLEEVGLIESPHISAGKIPTEKGYRFFVDEMLSDPTSREKKVAQIFQKHVEEYRFSKSKESFFDAVRLIARLSQNVAFMSIENDQTFYIGFSHVLRSPEFLYHPEKSAQILEVLEGRDRFQSLLSGIDTPDGEVKIFIGEENLLEEISSCSLLVARIQTPFVSGHLGILGPMRMDYGFNKALLENSLSLVL